MPTPPVCLFEATTNSNHSLPVTAGLLRQNFMAARPHQAWIVDATYTGADEGWGYLAVVADGFSGKIIGWSMAERMTATLKLDALRRALARRKWPRGAIVHADRSSQHRLREHRSMLEEYRLVARRGPRAIATTTRR